VSEERILLLRRLWLREVSALIEGKPLTDWKMPTAPFVSHARHAASPQKGQTAAVSS